ncbi:hypothetical protein ACR55_01828 [Bordetella hinzii]|uniref:Uncharacterized protein n=1 Tax=Bordetella hinzii TaxID=103855 RepID=A0AAN1S026_9BORD|nr:hypothetical protein [Bordetella hinzii]AKQ59698.1 hypothetical protein ACR55_01828 [Bordetella hinzii]AZW19179.1 hypothetical protein CS347_21665 [Bordetella hinzii]
MKQEIIRLLERAKEDGRTIGDVLAEVRAMRPVCLTCDDHGWIGGPSFHDPGEGGEPCPDCAAPVAAQAQPSGNAGEFKTDDQLGGLLASIRNYGSWKYAEAKDRAQPDLSDVRAAWDEVYEKVQALAAQAPAAKADALDAARYRWLRKGAVHDVAVVRGIVSTDYGMSAVVYTHSEEIDGDDLDATIDAAMSKEGKQ